MVDYTELISRLENYDGHGEETFLVADAYVALKELVARAELAELKISVLKTAIKNVADSMAYGRDAEDVLWLLTVTKD